MKPKHIYPETPTSCINRKKKIAYFTTGFLDLINLINNIKQGEKFNAHTRHALYKGFTRVVAKRNVTTV